VVNPKFKIFVHSGKNHNLFGGSDSGVLQKSTAIVLLYWLGKKYCSQYCNTFSIKYCYCYCNVFGQYC